MSPSDLGHDDRRAPVEPAGSDAESVADADSVAKSADGAESPDGAVAADGAAHEEEEKEVSPGGEKKRPGRRRVRRAFHRFFLPPQGSRLWRRWLPWATVVVIIAGLFVGGAHGWAWTNSPGFCGTTCHTMPPQYVEYQLSPHSRVSCVECHIGRDFIGKQLPRKAEHMQFIFRMAFGLYEYPIYAKGMRPARDACETCHAPAKFSNDSLIVKKHYLPDAPNSAVSISLVMKIGGGTEREGLGRGIHWHIENKVQFMSTDKLDQSIPYVRVTNDNGSVDEYVDVEAKLDPSTIDPKSLKTMDCITCHNRVSHTVATPVDSVEGSISRGVISSDIPYIRREAAKVLTAEYANQARGLAGISLSLNDFYKSTYPDFYAGNGDKVQAAIKEVQRIYSVSVFKDQEVDWTTHPDNVGHINSPGCFRCHDGKHLNAADQAIRLECNLCHSVPVVTGSEALVTNIEITHGPEPDSHVNANWISLHNRAYDKTCSNCHTTADFGGTSNTSFCSNSTCHGAGYKYAGFDAPALREKLKQQVLGPNTSTSVPSTTAKPTWASFFGALFVTKCGSCHGDTASASLDLTTYASAMAGGADGPVIVPGHSDRSLLVQVQSSEHHANFSAQELQAVEQWIDSGAPEK